MKKSTILTATALFIVAPLFASASFSLADWQFMRPIALPAQSADASYVRLNIDRTIAGNTQPSLADLRVISGTSEETPYQLVIENEEVRNEFVPSTITDLSTQNGQTMFIVDLGAERLVHDHLKIFTQSKNFKRPVTVYAADTKLAHGAGEWRLLSDAGVIYNYYDKGLVFDSGKGDVYYPESTSRYVRVVIGAGEGADVVVDHANVSRVLEKNAKLNSMAAHAVTTENTKTRATEMTIDLGTSGVATRRVTLGVDETKNFSRRVTVQDSIDGVHWNAAGDGYVFALRTPLFNGTNLSVSYRESLSRFVRVIVFNQDDQPLHLRDTVVLDGVARTVVFEAHRGTNYALYYGNNKAVTPQYDLARFFAYIEGAELPEATLSAEAVNASFVPTAEPAVPFTERNKTLINSVLVLLVAVVTFFLIGYLKKLKLEKPSSP